MTQPVLGIAPYPPVPHITFFRIRSVFPYPHESQCFVCGSGMFATDLKDMLLCEQCPKVYHIHCASLYSNSVASLEWQCPRHACRQCHDVTKPLYSCMTCPNSFCKYANVASSAHHILPTACCLGVILVTTFVWMRRAEFYGTTTILF
jgi:hypothetical protein